MTKMSRRGLLSTLGTQLVESGSAQSSARKFDTATSSREMIHQRYFPDVTLYTHEGKKVRFYDDMVKGKIITLNFMYAKCEGVCPLITSNLVKAQKTLKDRVGKDIFMLSLTLKPEEDSPTELKEYVEMHGIRPGWTFLTGDPKDLEMLRRKQGFVDPDPELDKDKSNHIGNVRYGNEPYQWWGACPGMAAPSFIVESILWVDWPNGQTSANGHSHDGGKGEHR